MTKQCSVCNAENRDEAQFCRACGSVFVTATGHGTFGDEPSADNICSECGFRNKPDIRYCANCGMNLSGSTDIAPLGDLAPLSEDADPGASPPPVSYASFATVEPYPPAPAMPSGYPPSLEDTAPLDIPDPDARIAIRQQEAHDAAPPEFMQAAVPAAPNQAKRVVIVGVAALVVAAITAWLFLGSESAAPPPAAPVVPALAPVAVPEPAPSPIASAPAPIIIEMPAVAAPAASSAMVESAPLVPPVAPEPVPVTPPTAAASLPRLTEPVRVTSTADADAKRLAAEKARRDKAARDKAERDAKAKALADQREQAAAAARAEQEAQARKRAEEAQRSRPVAAPTVATPASTQVRGVRETCAGRGTIAEAVCQSRLCSAAEHANEPICRQIREADERRRNLLN
jgi:ribosomal protein L40E